MKIYSKLLIILILVAFVAACKSKEPATVKQAEVKTERNDAGRSGQRSGVFRLEQQNQGGPTLSASMPQATAPVFIYKPKKEEYAQHIMVALDETKTKIASYPSRRDAKAQVPDKLGYGFFLDKTGIKTNMVVLKYTIQEWVAMDPTPSQEDMLQNILDDQPFEEIYYCGKRSDFGDNVEMGLKKRLESVEGKAEEIFKKAQ